MKYTESEKRALYESIMRDVAKSVKRHLNEEKFTDFSKEFGIKLPNVTISKLIKKLTTGTNRPFIVFCDNSEEAANEFKKYYKNDCQIINANHLSYNNTKGWHTTYPKKTYNFDNCEDCLVFTDFGRAEQKYKLLKLADTINSSKLICFVDNEAYDSQIIESLMNHPYRRKWCFVELI